MVTVTIPELLTEVGATEQVVPGSDATVQVRDTAPVNPFKEETVAIATPTFPVVPAVSERLVGEALTWKSGTTITAGVTVTAIVAVWVKLPLVP